MVEGKGIQGWDFSVRHAEIFERLCRSVPKSSEHLQGLRCFPGPGLLSWLPLRGPDQALDFPGEPTVALGTSPRGSGGRRVGRG